MVFGTIIVHYTASDHYTKYVYCVNYNARSILYTGTDFAVHANLANQDELGIGFSICNA